jgi:hypothetical protein
MFLDCWWDYRTYFENQLEKVKPNQVTLVREHEEGGVGVQRWVADKHADPHSKTFYGPGSPQNVANSCSSVYIDKPNQITSYILYEKRDKRQEKLFISAEVRLRYKDAKKHFNLVLEVTESAYFHYSSQYLFLFKMDILSRGPNRVPTLIAYVEHLLALRMCCNGRPVIFLGSCCAHFTATNVYYAVIELTLQECVHEGVDEWETSVSALCRRLGYATHRRSRLKLEKELQSLSKVTHFQGGTIFREIRVDVDQDTLCGTFQHGLEKHVYSGFHDDMFPARTAFLNAQEQLLACLRVDSSSGIHMINMHTLASMHFFPRTHRGGRKMFQDALHDLFMVFEVISGRFGYIDDIMLHSEATKSRARSSISFKKSKKEFQIEFFGCTQRTSRCVHVELFFKTVHRINLVSA